MVKKRFQLRFSLRVFLVVTFLVCLFLGYVVASRDPVVNRSNYNRIQLGMSRIAVDAILQQPAMEVNPLNYEDVVFEEPYKKTFDEFSPPHTVKSWKGDGYLITVHFDKSDRVTAKYYERAPDSSIIDHIADWLGL